MSSKRHTQEDGTFAALQGREAQWLIIAAMFFAVIAVLFVVSNQETELDKLRKLKPLLAVVGAKKNDLRRIAILAAQRQMDVEWRLREIKQKIDRIKSALGVLDDAELEEKVKEIKDAIERLRRSVDKPPLITLSETGGYNFSSGRAEVSEEFREKLRNGVVGRILKAKARYQIGVVEVVGHTDEVPNGCKKSGNLDYVLVKYLNGEDSTLFPCSNVDLGMARAVAIVKILSSDGRLAGLSILPYSAGQLVTKSGNLTDGTQSGSDPERRRIEVRLKRKDDD